MMCFSNLCDGCCSLFCPVTMPFSTAPTALQRSSVAQMYSRPCSSARIFCTIKVATVLLSSLPSSIVRKHNGMISVLSKKLITLWSSTFTSAPITPKLVSLRYSNGRCFDIVFKNGYRKNGMFAVAICDKRTHRWKCQFQYKRTQEDKLAR